MSSPTKTPAKTPTSQASALQAATRHGRRFSEIEASLPLVTQHPSWTARPIWWRFADLLADLLSRLFPYSPRSQPVAGTDVVWLFDNTAFQSDDADKRGERGGGGWRAEFVAAAFAQVKSEHIGKVAVQLASKLGFSAADDKILETIGARLVPFVMEIQPGRVVAVEVDGSTELQLGPCGVNGISSDLHDVLPRGTPSGAIASSIAKVPNSVTGMLDMKTVFAAATGWGVISDIDDTIKITQTSDPIGILKSTFVDIATPITGMPELYTYIHKLITPAPDFFYLSASPYNLYPFLREFQHRFYPHGQLILRDASWMCLSGLLSNLTLGTLEYKVDRMRKIHGWLPRKKMICIGDSTQSDPEAYGEIYRTHPGWVKFILIRRVTDIAAIGIEAKNEPERFEKAFEDVPRKAWHVFEDPSECYKLIDDVVRDCD